MKTLGKVLLTAAVLGGGAVVASAVAKADEPPPGPDPAAGGDGKRYGIMYRGCTVFSLDLSSQEDLDAARAHIQKNGKSILFKWSLRSSELKDSNRAAVEELGIDVAKLFFPECPWPPERGTTLNGMTWEEAVNAAMVAFPGQLEASGAQVALYPGMLGALIMMIGLAPDSDMQKLPPPVAEPLPGPEGGSEPPADPPPAPPSPAVPPAGGGFGLPGGGGPPPEPPKPQQKGPGGFAGSNDPVVKIMDIVVPLSLPGGGVGTDNPIGGIAGNQSDVLFYAGDTGMHIGPGAGGQFGDGSSMLPLATVPLPAGKWLLTVTVESSTLCDRWTSGLVAKFQSVAQGKGVLSDESRNYAGGWRNDRPVPFCAANLADVPGSRAWHSPYITAVAKGKDRIELHLRVTRNKILYPVQAKWHVKAEPIS